MVCVTQPEIPREEFGKVGCKYRWILPPVKARGQELHLSSPWLKVAYQQREYGNPGSELLFFLIYFLAACRKCKLDPSFWIGCSKMTWHLNYRKETVYWQPKLNHEARQELSNENNQDSSLKQAPWPSSPAVPTSPGAQWREQPRSSLALAYQLPCSSPRLGSSARPTAVLPRSLNFKKHCSQWMVAARLTSFSSGYWLFSETEIFLLVLIISYRI